MEKKHSIDWEFISTLEGKGVKIGYVPSDNSGVTIGTGFDLKEKNRETLESMNLDINLIDKLEPFFKLKGAEASEVASNLTLDDSEVKALDLASHEYYANNIIKKYEQDSGKLFSNLNSDQQTVITSVGFQYGSFERTPTFWKHVVNGDWDAVINELENFGDSFSTRRKQEANLLKKKLTHKIEKPESKYSPPINLWKQKDAGGELYLDRVFETYQNWTDKRERASFGAAAIGAISENQIIPSVFRLITGQTFKFDDNWSLENEKEWVSEQWETNGIRPEFYDEFIGLQGKDHFLHTIERVKKHQKNKDMLDTLGWKGTALEIGAFFLDPVSWTGYGAVAKMLKPAMMATKATRTQKFIKGGLAYGATEGALFGTVAADNPTYGTSDVIIAMALGGTLGGGINAIFAKNLNNIAKAEMLLDINESNIKLTKKGEKEFKKVKKPLNTKLLQETEDVIEDTSLIKDIGLKFGRIRDLPFLMLYPFNRSGTLGTSKSELVRLFNYLGHEEPVHYVFKKGKRKGQVAAQEDTVELVKNQILQTGHGLVYKDVLPALKAYLAEQGHGVIGGFFALSQKKLFMREVAKIIRSGKRSGNKHLDQAAHGFQEGFDYMSKAIVGSRIEGFERFLNEAGVNALKNKQRIILDKHLISYRQYLPRKMSHERLGEVQNKLGSFENVVELIRRAIADEQVGLAKSKTAKVGKKITDKTYLLARAIAKTIQLQGRSGGFDIEALVRIKDPIKLREYLEDVLPDLSKVDREELITVFTDNIKLVTSGRLESRIRLNENFETTINGIKARFDDLLENDTDLLWHGYVNEMSGLIAIAQRMGIKSRTERIRYQQKLNQSIDDAYVDKEAGSRYGAGLLKNKWVAREEKEVIDSFFKNILGRSAENDPTDLASTTLRSLRKYNFMRVLNQVGIAQLPEFGISTAQQGIGTLIQEIPHFKQLLIKAQKGELDDTFFEELAIMGSSNGSEYLWRGVTNYEIEDMGQTAIGKAHDASRKSKFLAMSHAGERATGYVSGLFIIDSLQRRLTMRLFVNRMAKDLIDVAESGTKLEKLGSRLNRYRVLGFTDEELLAIGREFSSKNVTTEITSFGRRVKHFNFANWADQNLAQTFARRVNRYTQRAVQYNYLGDTNRFFTDRALGKSMGQFRSFIMTAWSKQFLHNLALADMQTASTFLYTTMIASLAYIGQTNMNAMGMSASDKKKYLKNKLGDWKQGDYRKIAMASFQRAGWSSLIPSYSDMILSNTNPDNRFNFRTSGMEVNLWQGNPTIDLLNGVGKSLGAFLKTTRKDYRYSRTDFNRLMRLLPFQNMYGVNNVLNFMKNKSPFPQKGSTSGL